MSNLISFLRQIEWSFYYGIFQGSIIDSDWVATFIGNDDSGSIEFISPILSGSQKTKMCWYRDEMYVKFRVLSVSDFKSVTELKE